MVSAPKYLYQVYRVCIRATAPQVRDASTRPEFAARYFHGAHVETTATAGQPSRHIAPDRAML
jgi:hypothetical protein